MTPAASPVVSDPSPAAAFPAGRRDASPARPSARPAARALGVARRHPLPRLAAPLLAAAALLLAGCVSTPTSNFANVPVTGDPVVDGRARRAVAPPQDELLYRYRVAAAALRRDQPAIAKEELDTALLNAGAIPTGTADARRARRMFGRESAKFFLGEPYERVMAYYYRAILYWRDGEPDNARACYRSGQLIDGDAETASYRSDWALLDYLDGYATARLHGDGSDALKRARANVQATPGRARLPDYDLAANVLVFAEYGYGPRKYAGGEYGELLKFRTEDSRVRRARLILTAENRTVDLPPYDDLNFQATTRGGRVMDHILGNKAVFKSTTSNVGDAALIGAIATHQLGTGEDKDKAALALAGVGLLAKLASAATQTQADTRTWDNLPQSLSFAALRLPPGAHPARLEFLDAAGAVLPGRTRELTLEVPAPAGPAITTTEAAPTVIFLSELKQ